MNNKFLFWLLVILNVLDVLLTSKILDLGGQEVNPWMNYLVTTFGVSGLIIGKTPFLIALGVIIYKFWDKVRERIQLDLHNILLFLNLAFIFIDTYSLDLYLSLL